MNGIVDHVSLSHYIDASTDDNRNAGTNDLEIVQAYHQQAVATSQAVCLLEAEYSLTTPLVMISFLELRYA